MNRLKPLAGAVGGLVLAISAALAGGGHAVAFAAEPDEIEPLPRIAVGDDEERSLVVAETGETFVPRGNNYVRLAPIDDRHFHSTFEPGLYDAERADAALAYMHDSGYNVVRVFLDPGHPQHSAEGRPHGLGHGDDDDSVGNAAYLDNVADFIIKAATHGVYVLPAMDYYPFNAHYAQIQEESAPPQPNIEGWNAFYMQRSWINAKAAYLTNFLTEIQQRVGESLMTTLLAVQTDNEATYEANRKPFSLTSGEVTSSDGQTYNLSDPASRQALGDNSMVEYANSLVAAVHEDFPDMLVTAGMFTYAAVGKAPDGFSVHCDAGGDPQACQDRDYRYPARPASLAADSDLSFLDLHVYHEPNRTLDTNLASSEWDQVTGPVIVGEFGTQRAHHGDDVVAAATAMRDLQVATCERGFAGWLYWTWDTDEEETQRLFVTATEQDGAVNGLLAPAVRYDPCNPEPTEAPSPSPTPTPSEPTEDPTDDPRGEPTEDPTTEPTDEPSEDPTDEPTEEPSPTGTSTDSGGPPLPDTGFESLAGLAAVAVAALLAGAALLARRGRSHAS